MNLNVILAVLELKGVIDTDEANLLAEHLAQAPQSTYYTDALSTVTKLLTKK